MIHLSSVQAQSSGSLGAALLFLLTRAPFHSPELCSTARAVREPQLCSAPALQEHSILCVHRARGWGHPCSLARVRGQTQALGRLQGPHTLHGRGQVKCSAFNCKNCKKNRLQHCTASLPTPGIFLPVLQQQRATISVAHRARALGTGLSLPVLGRATSCTSQELLQPPVPSFPPQALRGQQQTMLLCLVPGSNDADTEMRSTCNQKPHEIKENFMRRKLHLTCKRTWRFGCLASPATLTKSVMSVCGAAPQGGSKIHGEKKQVLRLQNSNCGKIKRRRPSKPRQCKAEIHQARLRSHCLVLLPLDHQHCPATCQELVPSTKPAQTEPLKGRNRM